jgi:hypothetical protein
VVIRKKLVDILVLNKMIKGEFEDAEIVVIDIRPAAGHVDLWAGEQSLGRGDYGDEEIGEEDDGKAFGLPGAKKVRFG